MLFINTYYVKNNYYTWKTYIYFIKFDIDVLNPKSRTNKEWLWAIVFHPFTHQAQKSHLIKNAEWGE